MLLAPGTAVASHLRLVRPLGEGAMGSVWVAERAGTPRPVAIKFMAARPSRDRAALARFQREATAAAKIESPNVVSILEHGATTDGTHYIVMELLEGETLGARLARMGRLGLDDAAAIVRQVAYALDAAHRLGVVHRDIKPDNIFIVGEDDFPLVKILDFGMAKDTTGGGAEVTGTGVAVGTPEYMSPEQVLGGKDVDFQSDLWALGVVAYRMLSGVAPFDGQSPHAFFFTVCRGAYHPLDEVGIDARFEPWFRQALSPKKSTRFASGRSMVDAFDAALRELRADAVLRDEDEFGPTSQFDTAQLVAVLAAHRPSSAAPSGDVSGLLDDELATVANSRDPRLSTAVSAAKEARRRAVSSDVAVDARIDLLIAESMREGAVAAAPLGGDPALFERPSQRGVDASVVEELASLEEWGDLRVSPSDAPTGRPSPSDAPTARPSPSTAPTGRPSPSTAPTARPPVKSQPQAVPPLPEALTSLSDGARTLPIVDDEARPVARRNTVWIWMALVACVGAAAWFFIRFRVR